MSSPQISPNGNKILFVGHNEQPFRLGRIYCTNHPTAIFEADVCYFPSIRQITCDEFAAHTPRFINDNDFVYFRRDPWGPHADYHDLMICKNGDSIFGNKKAEHKMLVAADQKLPLQEDKDEFTGIFLVGEDIFLHENRLYLTTLWRNHHAIIEIDLANGHVRPVCFDDSVSRCLLDIDKTGVLVKESSHLQPDKLILITGESNRIELFSNKVPRFVTVDAKFEQRILQSTDSSNECFHCHGLVLQKDKYRMNKKKCLIMFIHGGPHSNMTNVFNAKIFGYLALGYDFIIPNYRGSVGYGAGYVRQLPSHISEKDVSDCFTAMEYATSIKPYDFKYVMGGSHGGFLSAWLTSKETFDACSIRNPVVDLNAMFAVTEIPDWVIYETTGKKYEAGHVLSTDELAILRSKSPISNASNCKTPTLMKIGLKDKRVPIYQGIEWVRSIKAKSKVLEYPEDNHTLSMISTEADDFIATHSWFMEHAISSCKAPSCEMTH